MIVISRKQLELNILRRRRVTGIDNISRILDVTILCLVFTFVCTLKGSEYFEISEKGGMQVDLQTYVIHTTLMFLLVRHLSAVAFKKL